MADKEWEDPTEQEKLAATRQKEISSKNASNIKNQLDRALGNYDYANEQNAALRDVQLQQAARKAETDRFQAQRGLRNAALGTLSAMGPNAYNSSALDNMRYMLGDRNDYDNVSYWQQLQENRDMVNNAYQENYNANQVAKQDAIAAAINALADIDSSLAANLANIHPDLYEAPGTNKDIAKATKSVTKKADSKALQPSSPTLSGYIMPAVAEQAVRNLRTR